MDVRKEITDELAKILQEEIDKEIVTKVSIKMFQDRGWHTVTCDTPIEDIGSWMQNVKGNWRAFYHIYLFEEEKDATLFRLTWT